MQLSGAALSTHLRSAEYILLALSCMLLFSSCAPVPESPMIPGPEPMIVEQGGTGPRVETNETDRLNLAIEPFRTILGEQDLQGHDWPRIREVQGRLLTIGLKRWLADRKPWGSVRIAPGLATFDDLVLRAALTFYADLPAELSIELRDQTPHTMFRHKYNLAEFFPARPDNTVQSGITDPYQALFAAVDSDLQAVLRRVSDKQKKQLQRAARENYFDSRRAALSLVPIAVSEIEAEGLSQRTEKALVYDELILRTINSYFDIYYDEFLAPYSTWIASVGNAEMGVSALLETESEILSRQMIGIGSVVEAVALQLRELTPKDALPLTPLLKNPLFASYSQFQPLEERRRAQASFDGLGLINNKSDQPLVLTVAAEQMALNGSVEEQYGWWRHMVVDLAAASEETTQDTAGPGQ